MFEKHKIIVGWTITLSTVYAIVRYHLFKSVPLYQFYPEIINKGISLGAILLICFSITVGPLSRLFPTKLTSIHKGKRYYGLWGFGLATIHSIVSIIFYKPNYYPRFFIHYSLNTIGEIVLYTGIFSLLLLSIAFIVSFPKILKVQPINFKRSQFAGYMGLIIAGVHVFPIGFDGWKTTHLWPGYLVPISLISFLAVIFTVLLRMWFIFMKKKKKKKS